MWFILVLIIFRTRHLRGRQRNVVIDYCSAICAGDVTFPVAILVFVEKKETE